MEITARNTDHDGGGHVTDERLFDTWFDPIEMELCMKVRGFFETMIEEELETALSRPRYGRRAGPLPEDDAATIASQWQAVEPAREHVIYCYIRPLSESEERTVETLNDPRCYNVVAESVSGANCARGGSVRARSSRAYRCGDWAAA